jgi:hypothetical protein
MVLRVVCHFEVFQENKTNIMWMTTLILGSWPPKSDNKASFPHLVGL